MNLDKKFWVFIEIFRGLRVKGKSFMRKCVLGYVKCKMCVEVFEMFFLD